MDTIDARGGCQCGAVRYRITARPIRVAVCHCQDCRRSVGAHAVAWAIVPLAGYTVTDGRPAEYRSSPPVRRTFCERCGTSLTYYHEELPQTIDVTIGSLDDPEAFTPTEADFDQFKLAWASPM